MKSTQKDNSDSSVKILFAEGEAPAEAKPHESFGQYLHREREFRGVTLEQVSQTTRISVLNLKALENDQVQGLPSPAFVKGFLRSIAREIGLDAQDLILRYEATLTPKIGGTSTSKRVVVKSLAPKGTAGSENTSVGPEEKRPWPWQAYVLIVLAVLFVGIVVTLFSRPVRMDQAAPKLQNTIMNKDELSAAKEGLMPEKENENPAQIPAEPNSSQVNLQAEKSVPVELEQVLVIRAKADSWLRIGLDEQPPVEIMLRKGKEATYKAQKTFDLFLGNAGGVEISFNDRELGWLGAEGQPKHLNLPSAKFPAR